MEIHSFSDLGNEEMRSMLIENNVKVVGSISFGSAEELLGDVALPASFIEQLEYMNNVNVSTVAPFL